MGNLFKRSWDFLKTVGGEFASDNVMALAAALAFYSTLSLAPLMVLLLYVAGLMGPETQANVVDQVEQWVGPQASEGIHLILRNASQDQNARSLAGILGLTALLFSASGVLGQMQRSLNIIWSVKADPERNSIAQFARKRLMSLLMLILIGTLLIGSIFISTALSAIPFDFPWFWRLIEILVPMAIFVVLFAMVYKVLPDVEIEWREVWFGAFLTAVLFSLGKYLIGLYLGRSSLASSYGAAGSLVVLLLWIYYSAIIIFLGAEITQVYARRRGRQISPNKYSIRVASQSPQPST